MPAFPPTVKPSQIDDFLMSVMHKLQKEDPTDIITPRYPLFMKMEKAEISSIIEENPGHGPVRDVYYKTEDRYIELSAGKRSGTRDLRPQEHSTRAQYDWVMLLNSLTIPLYDWENINTPEQVVDYLARKKKGTDKSHRNRQVTYLWDGATIGGMKLWGLKDAIRFTPTADPARGAVGDLGVADLPDWTNNSKNFNAAYATWIGGALTSCFIDEGSNSLLSLWSDCGYNDQDVGEAYPDLIPCNSVYWRLCSRLAANKIMFYDERSVKDLGVAGIAFQTATIFEDRNVPNDPNNSTYGVAYLLNTNVFNWIYARGIRNRWSKSVQHQVDTFYSFDKISEVCVAYSDLSRLGVHYGVNPTASAS